MSGVVWRLTGRLRTLRIVAFGRITGRLQTASECMASDDPAIPVGSVRWESVPVVRDEETWDGEIPPLCKDCRFVEVLKTTKKAGRTSHCLHFEGRQEDYFHVVTGETVRERTRMCTTMRAPEMPCGPDAVLFESPPEKA